MAFVWGEGGQPVSTAAEMKTKRALANAMLMRGTENKPIQHWAQGVGNVAQALLGSYMMRESDMADKAAAGANAADVSGIAGALAGVPAAGGQATAASTTGSGQRDSNQVQGGGGDISAPFLDTLRAGGITNPNALAAVGATGQRESAWSAANANRSWNDPSESGAAGMAGGALSWRAGRLDKLRQFAAANGEQGNGSPATQAKFFMQEDPALVERLNAAKTPEEAMQHMNNAWRFAGYNRPGGEAAARMAEAQKWVGRVGQPANPVANVPPMQGGAPQPMADPARAIPDVPASATAFAGQQPQQAPTQAVQRVAQAQMGAQQVAPVQPSVAPQATGNLPPGVTPENIQRATRLLSSDTATPGQKSIAQALMQKVMQHQTRDPMDARLKAAQVAEAEARLTDRPMATQKSQLEIAKMQREASAVDMDVREDPATGALIERRKGTNEPWTPVQGAGPKRATPTTDQTELAQINQERAVQNLPSLRMDEWKLQKGKASAPAVNIDQKQESEFGKETGKALAKRFDQLATDGDEASQNQVLVDEMRRLGGKVRTGASAAFTKRLGDMGIKLDGVSDIEAYSALIDRMTPAQRLPGSGATSDFDAKMFKGSLPNLMNTPGGNQIITDTMEKLNANKMARGDIAMRVQAGELKPNEGLAEIRKLQAEARGLSDSVRDFAKPKEGAASGMAPSPAQKRAPAADPLGLFQ